MPNSLDSFQIFYSSSAIYLYISCIFIIFAVGLLPFRFELIKWILYHAQTFNTFPCPRSNC